MANMYLIIALVEYLLVSMRGVYNGIDGFEVYPYHSCQRLMLISRSYVTATYQSQCQSR